MLNHESLYFKHYLNVILNSDGIILEVEANMLDIELNHDSLRGKNWYESFVEMSDREDYIRCFQNLFEGQPAKKYHFSSDIKDFNGKHYYMDFTSEVMIKDEEKVFILKGIPHYENHN
ncbi:MAG: hypothetical protein PHQ90_02155 [Sulfuricurvum sp.]|uniref:hypothetical protein n=1 Tax=Sulfuricurvum sp. TaxID=2025608 RepID=UPI002627E0EB|nr:hypothetical protein [Sulfuricurvum sp.]MDD2368075.1 hypothetical protein [Sulfuricurvum sp.]MDD2950577.1 hypothetical protein [Sulfuricurvum sp.]MDD5118583.1 hypothetical protein [Sulfuricurvum sp.]